MPLQHIRPKTLDEFHGNAGLKAALASKLDIKDQPKVFLFYGPPGCGKTTLAQIMARAYGCNMDKDYQEFDIGDARGIDDARSIKQNIHYSPMGGPVKVYVLDEVHASNSFFQDAMLKVLEEPPRHVMFILCTTEPGKLKATVKRRCHDFQVQPLNNQEMTGFIGMTLAREGLEGYPQDIINEIVNASQGSPGVAMKILDQVIDMGGDQGQIMELVRRTQVAEASVIDLCRSLLAKDWNGVARQLRAMPEKVEVEPVRRGILKYMRKVILGDRPNPQAAQVIMAFESPWFDGGLDGLVARCYMVMR